MSAMQHDSREPADGEEEQAPKAVEAVDCVAETNVVLDLWNANDTSAIEALLATAVVLRSLDEPNKQSIGRKPFMTKVSEIAEKTKGRFGERCVTAVEASTARATVKLVAPMGMKICLGFELIFGGPGLLKEMGLAKNPGKDFLEKRTANVKAAETLDSLKPPYLVPRPPVFPTPYVKIEIVEITPKIRHNPYLMPRPVMPYVKVTSSKGDARTTTLSPRHGFESQTWNQTLSLHIGPDDTELVFTLMDYNKIGRNQWLARTQLPLAKLKFCDHDETFALPLGIREKVRKDDLLPKLDPHPALICRLARFDVQAWWTITERARREEAAQKEAAVAGAPPKQRWWALWS